jgi:hypothetical protein
MLRQLDLGLLNCFCVNRRQPKNRQFIFNSAGHIVFADAFARAGQEEYLILPDHSSSGVIAVQKPRRLKASSLRLAVLMLNLA